MSFLLLIIATALIVYVGHQLEIEHVKRRQTNAKDTCPPHAWSWDLAGNMHCRKCRKGPFDDDNGPNAA